MNEKNQLLVVNNLKLYFHVEQGIVRAVDDVSFEIKRGRNLGLVGESGCGKTVTALTTMLLHPQPEGKIEGGEILFYPNGGKALDIAKLNIYGRKIRSIRGNQIAMIFQEPMMSLNPVYTIGQQITEAIFLHRKVDKRTAKEIAVDMLEKVRISAPDQRFSQYPHELSGGMRQRIMIAMALVCHPAILIADEPTTALDVTIEAEILRLMMDLREEMGMSILIITHDLGVVGEIADDVIVMYVGKVVEKAPVKELFQNPLHPYTDALLKSRPEIKKTGRLSSIKGTVPNPYLLPEGCYFASRCPDVKEICRKQKPSQTNIDGHLVYCWKY